MGKYISQLPPCRDIGQLFGAGYRAEQCAEGSAKINGLARQGILEFRGMCAGGMTVHLKEPIIRGAFPIYVVGSTTGTAHISKDCQSSASS